MQQMGMAPNGQPIITSQLQPMVSFYHSNYALCLRYEIQQSRRKNKLGGEFDELKIRPILHKL